MRFNLVMGCFWLCVGAGMVAAHYSGFELMGIDRDRTLLVGVFAFVLAAYNGVRWWAAHASAKSRPPSPKPRKRVIEERPSEYNPAFDFTRPEPPKE
jgi:hypothetical protein